MSLHRYTQRGAAPLHDPVQHALWFGKELIRTYDLDPVYAMLNTAGLRREELTRWCLLYWMTYRVDVASSLCNASPFWPAVERVVLAQASPRGSERRHYRGGQAAASLRWLQDAFPEPEAAVERLQDAARFGWVGVVAEAQRWHGFGKWIAFKIADMSDVVLGVLPPSPGAATAEELSTFYAAPIEGARSIAPLRFRGELSDVVVLREGMKQLRPLRRLAAPHWGKHTRRKIGWQELETVLCKFKSHCSGHYPVGKDRREVLHYLQPLRHQRGGVGSRMYQALEAL